MKGLIRIEVALDGTAEVYGPIWSAVIIKELPAWARRWDDTARCWRVKAYLDFLIDSLKADGYLVRVIRPGSPIPPLQLSNRQIRGPEWPSTEKLNRPKENRP